MINLDNEVIKTCFKSIIESEIDKINFSVEEQQSLNAKVFGYLSDLSSNTPPNADDLIISDVSAKIVSASELLKIISGNIKTLTDLLENLRKIKETLSIADNKTIKKILQYNETYTSAMDQISINTLKIEKFIKESNSTYTQPIVSTPEPSTSIDEQLEETLLKMNNYIEQIKQVSPASKIKQPQPVIGEQPKEEVIAQQPTIQEKVIIQQPIIQEEAIVQQPVVQEKETIQQPVVQSIMQEIPVPSAENIIEIVKENQEEVLDEIIEEKSADLLADLTKDLQENTLIISEVDKKVILPYKIDDIIQIFKDNLEKFVSLQQIIDKFYTIPLKDYKHSSNARFKEAFNLVRKKEKGSVFKALDLALELFSNYNLHPAIITACKDMHELDVYLSCLEYNELDDFNFFNIKFITPPAKVKKSKRALASSPA
ncbi:MAG: hypothetical protein FWF46_01770 [Oscillospiraceae bacterium]|nr:hypothetical protein [Oscillospiraceae bacterium]